jgi:hypothetical protein
VTDWSYLDPRTSSSLPAKRSVKADSLADWSWTCWSTMPLKYNPSSVRPPSGLLRILHRTKPWGRHDDPGWLVDRPLNLCIQINAHCISKFQKTAVPAMPQLCIRCHAYLILSVHLQSIASVLCNHITVPTLRFSRKLEGNSVGAEDLSRDVDSTREFVASVAAFLNVSSLIVLEYAWHG